MNDRTRESLERGLRAYWKEHRSFHAGFYTYNTPGWVTSRREKAAMKQREEDTIQGKDLTLCYRPTGMK